jgi:hypothetical protein
MFAPRGKEAIQAAINCRILAAALLLSPQHLA